MQADVKRKRSVDYPEEGALEVESERLNRDSNQFPERVTQTKLAVNDLRKSFLSPAGKKIEVLKGVSFSAVAGETVAIVGASGAGKSTLLHLLGGLETAEYGQMLLNDFSIGGASPDKLAEFRNTNVGFIFQFHHLLPDLTAAENVALPLMISGVGQAESLRRAKQALEEVALDERADHPVSYLSGGEQQRVAVSRALIGAPILVLADEPTGNLDASIENEISRRLITYTRDLPGILVVATHNEQLAKQCDRFFELNDGKLLVGN